MDIDGFRGDGFDPKDWHVDLQTSYVTYFPADIGFSVGFLPRDFESDGLAAEDFIAEPVHFPAWGAVPNDRELARLCRIAATSFALRLRQSLQRRISVAEAIAPNEAPSRAFRLEPEDITP